MARSAEPAKPSRQPGAWTLPTLGAEVPAGLDPYYRWAVETGWRSVLRSARSPSDKAPETVRVLVEAPACQTPEERQAMLNDKHWQVAEAYKASVPGSSQPSRYFSATLKRSELPWLAARPHGVRWELAAAMRDGERAARANPMGLYGSDRDPQAFRPLQNFARIKGGVPASAERGVIGVIDFGCPFLNQRFARSGGRWLNPALRKKRGKDDADPGTRLIALWDQGSHLVSDSIPGPWCKPPRWPYGRALNRASMDAVRDAVWRPGGCSEEDAYRRLDYLIAYEDARRRVWRTTHGAHVLDLLAGNEDPLRSGADDEEEPDAAGQADLVFVQLPTATAADASGASLGAQLLDGVRYIMELAPPEQALVLNISYGTQAGPHDGSSLIERALDELLELRADNFAIVLAAGNAAQAGAHLRRRVELDRSALLRLQLGAGDTTDSYVEIWYGADQVPVGAALELRVRTPELQWSNWVPQGEQVLLTRGEGGQAIAMLRHDATVPNGARAMALLAFVPTMGGVDDVGPLATPGLWLIEVRLRPLLKGAKALQGQGLSIDAWLERDNAGDLADSEPSRFLGLHSDDAEQTLCSLATGAHSIVVGGMRLSDGQVPEYASRGGRSSLLPALLAACEIDALRPGLLAAGVRSAELTVMNGTSVAAPVLARRVFNWMSAELKRGKRIGRGVWPKALRALAKRDPYLGLG